MKKKDAILLAKLTGKPILQKGDRIQVKKHLGKMGAIPYAMFSPGSDSVWCVNPMHSLCGKMITIDEPDEEFPEYYAIVEDRSWKEGNPARNGRCLWVDEMFVWKTLKRAKVK